MLSCEAVMAELAHYLEEQISPQTFQELQAHLSQCNSCRVLYDSTRKTLRIVTESRSFELPEPVSLRVMEKVMSRVRSKQAPKNPDS